MSYEIRHFDTPLIRFSATEDSCSPEIQILWMNEQKKDLFPLDLQATNEGIRKWLKRRTIPKNRAYVHNFLSKCGLSINRPMSIIKASKGLSLNDCYWVVEEGFTGTFSKFNLYENRFSQILALIAFTGHGTVSASHSIPALNSHQRHASKMLAQSRWSNQIIQRRYQRCIQHRKRTLLGVLCVPNCSNHEYFCYPLWTFQMGRRTMLYLRLVHKQRIRISSRR